MTFTLAVYDKVMGAFHGLAPGILKRRAKAGKEDAARLTERLGVAGAPRPDGPVVWFHGVSVGESLSAVPVIEVVRRERPDIHILVTTGTTTSAEILGKRLPDKALHQYAPVDTPQAVKAFLDHWRPDLAVFIESDIWPILLRSLGERDVPHVLLSARITEKTYRGWQAFGASIRRLVSGYALVMAQDSASEARLQSVGARLGERANLKTLGAPLPVSEAGLAAMHSVLSDRKVIFAASTHYGEDSIIAKTVEGFVRQGDLLILAPRHPVRAGEIRLDLEALGLIVAQRSLKEPVTEKTHIYLADTLGELGLFFSLAHLVIMGGSFMTGIGGHNPLEAARLGKAVITGPDISNWLTIFEELFEAGAAFKVAGPQELGFLVEQLRGGPEAVETADRAAKAVSERQLDTMDKVWKALFPLLPEPV